MNTSHDRIVVIGASAGGVHALLEIAGSLPPAFPAAVCITQHVGSHPSLLPELLRYRGPNPAVHGADGQHLSAGTLFVAPPDRHMLLEGDTIRLTRGPKENHARPAIDPLFRSAALSFGPRVVGVVLTGQMDDGTAGLKAVKECGGVAVVQDPATAAEREMPESALRHVAVDHCIPLADIAGLLVRLAGSPVTAAPSPVPLEVIREVAINRGEARMENLVDIAAPSSLTCPDCGGVLWEMRDPQPLRYRCHTGHAYSSLSLAQSQDACAEHALRSAVRALRERELLLRRLAALARTTGDAAQAAAGEVQADRLRARIAELIRLAEAPHPVAADAATP